MSAGAATRSRHIEAMKATAVGAKVARGTQAWTIVQRRELDCAVRLTLQRGRRAFTLSVPVCITGPCWADVDLRPVAAAPTQRGLFA